MALLRTAATLLALATSTPGLAASMDDMRWQRRVLLVSSPGPEDPRVVVQRRIFVGWPGAADRDMTLVQVLGSEVSGAQDDAPALRRRYHLTSTAFEVLLIGKDGHVALRSHEPIPADTLQATIDAMPMRRNGGR